MVKTLLRPAVFLLNRLSYPYKLALIGFVLFLPFVVAGYLIVSETSADISFAGRELSGLRAVRPLKALMHVAQEHRGTARLALLGDPEAPRRLDHLEQQAGEVIRELDAFDAEFGRTFKSADEWAQVKSRWNSLRRKTVAVSAEESFSRHTAFIECVQALLLHVADASGLSLDPELDTHYLVFAVTFPLTQWAESLGQGRALSAGMAWKQSLSPSERYRLSKLAGESQRVGAKAQTSLEAALALTPGLRESIGSPLEEARLAVDSFLSSAEELLLQPDGIQPNSQAMFRQGTLAIDAVYKLSGVSLVALQETIRTRADRLVLKRHALIAFGAVVMLLTAYLFFGFTSALMQQMGALRRGAKEVVEGNLNTRIVPDSHDEMALIACFFNAMVDSLRDQMARVAQGKTELRRSEEKYRALLDQAGDALIVADLDGNLLEANRSAEKMFGYGQEELRRLHVLDLCPEDAREKMLQVFEALRECGFSHMEHQMRRKDGTVISADISAARVEYETGMLVVAFFRDISLIKESQQRIEYLANFDALTGLPNRNLFHDRLKHAVARASRQGDGFALMFVDLDNFKTVNDTLGHDAGDLLLQEAARRLEKCIRDGDTAARLGGDEFTVLLETSEQAAVGGTAQRIVEVLAAAFALRDGEVYVSCSIGISIYPDDGADDQTLMKNADIAMYRAKQQGKNNFRFFGD
jgi:diguanylate cyclase (GGDEF)-like protein/PAS domain S-box-containing protein